MKYYHRRDNGEIVNRTCGKCKRHWSLLGFALALDVKPYQGTVQGAMQAGPKIPVKKGTTSYAGWANKVPGAGLIASRLPKWSRGVRILVTLAFITIVVLLISVARNCG